MSDDRQEAIRRRAYELWEKEGGGHGRDEAHWHQATDEIGDGEGGNGVLVAPDGTTLEAGTPADQTATDAPVAPPVRKGGRKAAATDPTPADQTPVDGPAAPPVKAKAAAKPPKPKPAK